MPTPAAPIAPGPTSRNSHSPAPPAALRRLGQPAAPPLILLHGGRDHCRSWDWVASRLASRLARDRAGPARAWRQRLGGRRQLHDPWSYLRPGPAHPSAEARAGDDGRAFARRQRLCALRRPLSGQRCQAGIGRGPWHDPQPGAPKKTTVERTLQWLTETRDLAGHLPRRYASLDEAVQRMKEANSA